MSVHTTTTTQHAAENNPGTLQRAGSLHYCPNYSWDAPATTLKLGPVPTIVGTIIKLGRNMYVGCRVCLCLFA